MKNLKHVSRQFGFIALALAATLLTASSTRGQGSVGTEDAIPPNAQSAIDRGLEWLAGQQDSEGFFPGSPDHSPAIASLAVMAFLSRGHIPGQGPYGDLLNKSIDCVLAQQRQSGLIATGGENYAMYNHGISTVMLCEVYGMVDANRQIKIHSAVSAAIKLILDAQKNSHGGWRYTPTSTDEDMSVTAWQLMALRGANVGAAVPAEALHAGTNFVLSMATPDGGFGYINRQNVTPSSTGAGILSLELLGQHSSEAAIAGGDFLLRHPLNSPGIIWYSYAVYYCSQAANQLGGKYWTGIYRPLRDTLIANQNPDGSWKSESGQESAGHVYATSMAILALNVPYRYLPLYQR